MKRESLIGEYLFTGNTNDTSGGGRHAVVPGATLTDDRFGDANSAFHFDVVDDYIVYPLGKTIRK